MSAGTESAHPFAAKRISTDQAMGQRQRVRGRRRSSSWQDITIIAVVVPMVSGRDHCQPMVSCDHMAMPKARKAARAQPSETTLARTCSVG